MAGHSGDTPTIVAALTDVDPMVRRLALGAADKQNLLDLGRLRAALADSAEQVVRRAIELTPRSNSGARLWPELVNLLGDDRYCELAAFALGELEIPDEALDPTTQALSSQATDHSDPLARESAVAALGALGTGLDAILHGTEDVATVRRRAVLALAAFDDDRAEAALTKALDDRDWQVRQAAEDLTETSL